MKLSRSLAAFAVAGALTLGAAAPALAEAPPERPARACVVARHALADLRQANRQLNRELARLTAAVERAEDAGRTALAERLQARHDALAARQDRVQARIAAARERLAERCAPTEVPAT